jgi:2-keto-3-deoxy-L-rhamnonate aldolase RhmA
MNDTSDGKGWRNPSFVDNVAASRLADSLRLGNALRRKTAAGFALGTFVIEYPVPATLHALAMAGFDFVVIDMEHSSVDFAGLEGLIAAGQAAGLAILVRPWGEDAGLIGKTLDLGANGVMVPHVESAERARAIVEQARFAPLGGRGFSPLARYDCLREPLRELNEATFVVVQIEGRQGIANVAGIAATDGIDGVFVGPYDLALSLGVPPGSEAVFAAAERLAAHVPSQRVVGIYIDDPTTCAAWATRRFALQCVSFDGRMLAGGARAIATSARAKARDRKAGT